MRSALLLITTYLILVQSSMCQFDASNYVAAIETGAQISFKDIDNDGDLDQIYANTDRVSIQENIGSMKYNNIDLNIPLNINSIRESHFVDLNNDGLLDYLSICSFLGQQPQKIFWMPNLGDFEFGYPILFSSNMQSISSTNLLEVIDYENDGDLDVLCYSSETNTINWYENQNNGTFTAPTLLSNVPLLFNDLQVVDIDQDGDKDIFLLQNPIFWIENLGSGSYASISEFSPSNSNGVSELVFNDIDNDQDDDIIFLQGNGLLYWKENLGNTTFAPTLQFGPVPIVGEKYCIGDFNGDGTKDIATTSQWGQIDSWFPNSGNLQFNVHDTVMSYSTAFSRKMIALDYDLDGNDEIIRTGNKIEVLNFENSGSDFSRALISPMTQVVNELEFADITNDGTSDILMLCNGLLTSVKIDNNSSTTPFTAQSLLFKSVLSTTRFGVGDLNNDGLNDIVFSEFMSGNNHSVRFAINNGSDFDYANSIEICQLNGFNDPEKIILGDIDNDGDDDILLFTFSFSKIAWIENLGNLNFGAYTIIENAQDFGSPMIVDLNLDGNFQILCKRNNALVTYNHQGGGSFQISPPLPTTNAVNGSCLFVDVNNDGDIDILYCNNNNINLLENQGNGNFSSEVNISNSFNGLQLFWVDLNADGFKEILFQPNNNPTLFWIDNQAGVFGQLNSITLEYNERLIHGFDYDHDLDDDLFIQKSNYTGLVIKKNLFNDPSSAKGIVFYDENTNGIQDINEYGLSNVTVKALNEYYFASTNSNGTYSLNFSNAPYSNYTIQPDVPSYWSITNSPPSYNLDYNEFYALSDTLNFGLFPNSQMDSIEVDITGGFPRCNNEVIYWITVRNFGSTKPNCSFSISLDDSLQYISATFLPDSIISNTIYWTMDSINYFEEQVFKLIVLMPDFQSIGDLITSSLSTSIIGSSYVQSDSLIQEIVCAYDPNDKSVFPMGYDEEGYISAETEFLEYTVRFQNTGNDTATNIAIHDYLDHNLLWSSIEVISFSHPMTSSIDGNGMLKFSFNQIFLPDSATNQLGSQGFVKYKVKLKENLTPETQITNTAFIYFDSNPAIITNTTKNTIEPNVSGITSLNPMDINISVYPNPFENQVTVKIMEDVFNSCTIVITDITGRIVSSKSCTDSKTVIPVDNLKSGVYVLNVFSYNNQLLYSTRIIKSNF